MKQKRVIAPALAIASLFFSVANAEPKPSARDAAAPPLAIVGIWQVAEVNIDSRPANGTAYQPNDFRLKGRLLTVTRDKLSTDLPQQRACSNPQLTIHHATTTGLSDRYADKRSMAEMPQDYRQTLADNTRIDAMTVTCTEGLWGAGLGHEDGIRGAWIIALPNDRLSMRWYGGTVLMLKSLPSSAGPDPSFSCEKAVAAAEKAICGSISLAAFDRSVAESYTSRLRQLMRTLNPQAVKRLQESQDKWRQALRTVCGERPACLQKAMRDRLDALALPELPD